MTQETTYNLVELDQDEWERRHRCDEWLTASMVSSILGYNEWESPFALFNRLRGFTSPPTEEQEFRFAVGHHMEPLLGEWYTRRTGRPIIDPGPYAVAVHPDMPYFMASPDLVTMNGQAGLVECKTTEVWTSDAEAWKDGKPPLRVQCQLQAQLACTGLTWGSLVGMVGLGQFFHVDVERNEDFIAAMLECVEDFKGRLETNDPPPVDGNPSTREALKKLFPEDDGSTVDLDFDEARAHWEFQRELKETLADLDRALEGHKNWFFQQIGDARIGMAGANKFTLATIKRSPTLTVKLGDASIYAITRLVEALDELGYDSTVSEPEPYRQLYPPKKWK